MRSTLLVLVTTTIAFGLGRIAPTTASPEAHTGMTPDSSGVAVVELFTSEGCASCPPADRLLRSLVESARSEDQPIYALSFHVDYWNYLGWEDPYSDSTYSERQRRYDEVLGVDTYTPQIVVNGRTAMIGSRDRTVHDAIDEALSDPASVSLSIQTEVDPMTATVTYRLDDSVPDEANIQLALVERGLSQNVEQGENEGRTLIHSNVVRSLRTVSAQSSGRVPLSIPEGVDRSKASVIAFVQASSLAILGATRADLRTPSSAE